MTIHKAYVEHLLNGYKPVKYGGQMVSFDGQSGAGWFSDKARSLWSGAKALFNKHVRPVISQTVAKHAPVLLEAGKQSLNEAFRNVANADGSVKDRLRAGLASVKNDLQTGKFNSSDIIRKRDQPKTIESMMLPSDDIMAQHEAIANGQTPAVYGQMPSAEVITGQSGYGVYPTGKRRPGRPRKV